MIALQAQKLAVSISGTPVLLGVDVQFQQGCWTAIVGPNGAGKSTLLKALAGLIPSHGQIHLLQQNLRTLAPKHRAKQLAWLGQNTHTGADMLTVYDTVMLGRLPHQGWLSAPTKSDREAVEIALEQTRLSAWRERLVSQLSGGERQRALMARVLAVQAQVILMDEPLASLDPPHQVNWVDMVRQLTAGGTTVISVLHEVNLALAADHLVIVKGGQLIHNGPCNQLDTHRALESAFEHRIKVLADGSGYLAHLKLTPV
jgi:iron complex transport system ATP-binding protein